MCFVFVCVSGATSFTKNTSLSKWWAIADAGRLSQFESCIKVDSKLPPSCHSLCCVFLPHAAPFSSERVTASFLTLELIFLVLKKENSVDFSFSL